MEQLQAMGFEAYKCEWALAECGQNVEAAVEFVVANSHQSEEWWRQEAASLGEVPAKAAPKAAKDQAKAERHDALRAAEAHASAKHQAEEQAEREQDEFLAALTDDLKDFTNTLISKWNR